MTRGRGVRATRFALEPTPPAHEHPEMMRAVREPDAVSLVRFAPEVFDQGPVGSCVGHAWACAIATRAAYLGVVASIPSPDSLYRFSRCLERALFPEGPSEPLSDSGTDSPALIRATEQYGVCAMHAPTPDGRYSDCTPESAVVEPSITELETADHTRIVGAFGVYGDRAARVAQCRALLARGVPIVVESFVDTAYERLGPGVVVDHCDRADPKGGGHAECLLGYRTLADGSTLFLKRNSWSRAWGDEGSVWITERNLGEASGLFAADVTIRSEAA